MTEPSASATPPDAVSAACRLPDMDVLFLSAVLAHPGDACGAALLTLLRLSGARAAILVAKEGQSRRRLFARRADGSTIGRPDKVLRHEHVQRVLLAEKSEWVQLAPDDAVSWAGLRVETGSRTSAVLLVSAVGPEARGNVISSFSDARKLSLILGVALALEQSRCDSAREDDGGMLQGWKQLGGLALAPRGVLEYCLSGNPETCSGKSLLAALPEIVGKSPPMVGLLHSIATAARSDIPVLIEGESGTGKELVARAIHKLSERREHPFLGENCGALPENLAEAEIFGHERGAFTGAGRQKAGIFERARGGTVFLDEVGEMDLPLQKKLLRVLEEKEVRRVGGDELVRLDFRLISATNRALDAMVSAGQFREDLYYRLNVATITTPALRDRREDIPILIGHFNETITSEMGRAPLVLSEKALAVLQDYAWPGNVRELRNEVWNLACKAFSHVEPSHLSRRILHCRSDRQARAWRAANPLEEVERDAIGGLIREALRLTNGNHAEAARKLGISRSSLYRRLRRYNICLAAP